MKTKTTQAEPTEQELGHFVHNNVLTAQDHLLNELFTKEIFSWDDVANMYEYKCPNCGQGQTEPFDSEQVDKDDESFDAAIKYMCYECKNEFTEEPEMEAQEVFTWYLVNEWLGKQLQAHGEPVLNNEYGTWWGRTCFGQAISLDSVIKNIYTSLNS